VIAWTKDRGDKLIASAPTDELKAQLAEGLKLKIEAYQILWKAIASYQEHSHRYAEKLAAIEEACQTLDAMFAE
jgi:hypothetical protein